MASDAHPVVILTVSGRIVAIGQCRTIIRRWSCDVNLSRGRLSGGTRLSATGLNIGINVANSFTDVEVKVKWATSLETLAVGTSIEGLAAGGIGIGVVTICFRFTINIDFFGLRCRCGRLVSCRWPGLASTVKHIKEVSTDSDVFIEVQLRGAHLLECDGVAAHVENAGAFIQGIRVFTIGLTGAIERQLFRCNLVPNGCSSGGGGSLRLTGTSEDIAVRVTDRKLRVEIQTGRTFSLVSVTIGTAVELSATVGIWNRVKSIVQFATVVLGNGCRSFSGRLSHYSSFPFTRAVINVLVEVTTAILRIIECPRWTLMQKSDASRAGVINLRALLHGIIVESVS